MATASNRKVRESKAGLRRRGTSRLDGRRVRPVDRHPAVPPNANRDLRADCQGHEATKPFADVRQRSNGAEQMVATTIEQRPAVVYTLPAFRLFFLLFVIQFASDEPSKFFMDLRLQLDEIFRP